MNSKKFGPENQDSLTNQTLYIQNSTKVFKSIIFDLQKLIIMLPKKQGLYSPDYEHDNCGAGFICSLEGEKTNDIIGKALDILVKL